MNRDKAVGETDFPRSIQPDKQLTYELFIPTPTSISHPFTKLFHFIEHLHVHHTGM